MARTKTFSVAVPHDQLKNQIDGWASSRGLVTDQEDRNIAFLRAICDKFQTRMEAYYKAGATQEDRLRRLDEICQALIEIGFKDGERTFTIAAPFQPPPERWEDVVVGAGCEPGERCTRGACM